MLKWDWLRTMRERTENYEGKEESGSLTKTKFV